MPDSTPSPLSAQSASPPRPRLNVELLDRRRARSNTLPTLASTPPRWTVRLKRRRASLVADAPEVICVNSDFEDGDCMLVCGGGAEIRMGFRMSSSVLKGSWWVSRMRSAHVSEKFRNLDIPVRTPIEVAEKAHDVHAFLRFIADPAGLNLDIWQVQGVQRVIVAWCAQLSTASALCEYVFPHAARLVSQLSVSGSKAPREVLLQLVKAVAEMRFVELWKALFESEGFRYGALNPSTFADYEIELVGAAAVHVLRFVASFHPSEMLEGQCCVWRDHNQLFHIIVRFGERQIMYSDNTL